MLSSHRAASVPTCSFYKTHCLVAQHMAQEFVVLFKKTAIHTALPLPGRRQLKAVPCLSFFLTNKGNTALLRVCFVLWIVGSAFVTANMPARFSQLCCIRQNSDAYLRSDCQK